MKKNVLLAGFICFLGFSVTAQNPNLNNRDLNANVNQNADLGNYSTFYFTSDIKDKAQDIKSSSTGHDGTMTDGKKSDNKGKAFGHEVHDGTYGDDAKAKNKDSKKSSTEMSSNQETDANLNKPKDGYKATNRADDNTSAETGSTYNQSNQTSNKDMMDHDHSSSAVNEQSSSQQSSSMSSNMSNSSSASMIADDEWKKVKQGIKYELTSRGYKMDANNPDLVVSFQILKDDMEINNLNTSTGPAIANQTAEIQKGSLLVTISERKSGEVVWRGISNRSITENGSMDDDSNVNMAVASVFNTFGFEADAATSTTR